MASRKTKPYFEEYRRVEFLFVPKRQLTVRETFLIKSSSPKSVFRTKLSFWDEALKIEARDEHGRLVADVTEHIPRHIKVNLGNRSPEDCTYKHIEIEYKVRRDANRIELALHPKSGPKNVHVRGHFWHARVESFVGHIREKSVIIPISPNVRFVQGVPSYEVYEWVGSALPANQSLYFVWKLKRRNGHQRRVQARTPS